MKDSSQSAPGQQQLSIGAGSRAHVEDLFDVMREIRRLLDEIMFGRRRLDQSVLPVLYGLVIEGSRIAQQLAIELGMPCRVPGR